MTTPSTSAQGPVAEAARFHAVDLEQCALFVDSAPLKKSMTDAAAFLRKLTASPCPTASPASPSGVEAIAELVDSIARCRSENAMDRAFLDNSDEIAAAVLKLIADRDGEWACAVNRLEDQIASLATDATLAPKCTYCGDTGTITDRVDGEITCPECGYATPAPTSGSEEIEACAAAGYNMDKWTVPAVIRSLAAVARFEKENAQIAERALAEPASDEIERLTKERDEHANYAAEAIEQRAEMEAQMNSLRTGGDVREALVRLLDAPTNVWAQANARTVLAALSSSAGPAVEPVAQARAALISEGRTDV